MTKYQARTINEIVNGIFENFLPGFWKRAGTNEQLIRGFSQEFENLSADINNLYNQLSIETATGNYLNELGIMFKVTRPTGMSDSDYRNLLKNIFQIYLYGGTSNSISKLLALYLGLEEEKVQVNHIYKFNGLNFIAAMEPGEIWFGTGQSMDTTLFYKGTQSVKLTAAGAGTVYGALDRTIDVQFFVADKVDVFKVWGYFDDVTKIIRVRLLLADGTVTATGTIAFDGTEDQYGDLIFYKKDFTNTATIDWNNILYVGIFLDVNAATIAYFDWMEQGSYSEAFKFNIHLVLPPGYDTGRLTIVPQLISQIKSVGTYFNELTYAFET